MNSILKLLTINEIESLIKRTNDKKVRSKINKIVQRSIEKEEKSILNIRTQNDYIRRQRH